MKKIIEPKENVIYTFIYSNGVKHAFRFLSKKPNGDLIMLNCSSNTEEYITMSPKRFDFLYNKQLVSEVEVEALYRGMQEVTADQIDQGDVIDDDIVPDMIIFLDSINGEDNIKRAVEIIGMTPHDLARELEDLWFGAPDGELGPEFGNRLDKAVSNYYKLERTFNQV